VPGSRRGRALRIGSALAVVLCAACQHHGTPRIRLGTALAPSRPGTTISARDIPRGATVYLIEPAPRNISDKPLRILSVTIEHVSPSLIQGRQCSYEKTVAGVTVATWATGDEADWNPGRLGPIPMAGTTLPPHADLPDGRYALAQFKVVSAIPSVSSSVVYTYRQGGNEYRQVMAWRFVVNSR
jgi:hypothetical protein